MSLIKQLRQMLPGIGDQDAPRFAASLSTPGPYAAMQPREGVERGTLRSGRCPAGAVYPGVPHDYQVYLPARAQGPAALLVCMDGARYLGPEANTPAVLDALIAEGAIPPTVAVFIEPGAEGPGLPIYGGAGNRSIEYDSPGDAYARFLLDELLPQALAGVSVTDDPAQRVLCGLSSSGHCALNAAWERPDAFGKVISHCGSFVALRGGHELASKIRREPHGLRRVFLQTGEHDLDIVFGSWLAANRDMAAALAYAGIEHR
uniref:alpha/beta hydrolase n=1 Tax=Pelomonas sp. KK5 TaxID=1855730 RepID=UPI001180AB78